MRKWIAIHFICFIVPYMLLVELWIWIDDLEYKWFFRISFLALLFLECVFKAIDDERI